MGDGCVPTSAEAAGEHGSSSEEEGLIDELQAERDEARKIATHLMKHSVDCWSYQAELIEAYPWMKEAAAEPAAAPEVEEERKKPLTPDEVRARNYRQWGGDSPPEEV